jgi:hypothetical protein
LKTPVNNEPTLAEAGIDKNLAKQARKLSSIPEPGLAQGKDQGTEEPKMAVNIGMSVSLDREASSETIRRIDRDYAIAVVGPDGTLFTVDEDGSVEGDPEAVERAALPDNSLRARGLLALARLAKKVVAANLIHRHTGYLT